MAVGRTEVPHEGRRRLLQARYDPHAVHHSRSSRRHPVPPSLTRPGHRRPPRAPTRDRQPPLGSPIQFPIDVIRERSTIDICSIQRP